MSALQIKTLFLTNLKALTFSCTIHYFAKRNIYSIQVFVPQEIWKSTKIGNVKIHLAITFQSKKCIYVISNVLCKEWVTLPNRMNFRKNPNGLWSPPSFRKIILQLFSENVRKKPFIKVKNLQYDFWIENDPLHPFQTGSNASRPTKRFKSQTSFWRVLDIQTSWILLNIVNHSTTSHFLK